METDAEILSGLEPGYLFQDGDQNVACRTRQYGAAKRHREAAGLPRQRSAKVLADIANVGQVEVAVPLAGCSHADESEIGAVHRHRGIRRCHDFLFRKTALDQVPDFGFDDRRFSPIQEIDLRPVGIDTDDDVPARGQTPNGDGTDIP